MCVFQTDKREERRKKTLLKPLWVFWSPAIIVTDMENLTCLDSWYSTKSHHKAIFLLLLLMAVLSSSPRVKAKYPDCRGTEPCRGPPVSPGPASSPPQAPFLWDYIWAALLARQALYMVGTAWSGTGPPTTS